LIRPSALVTTPLNFFARHQTIAQKNQKEMSKMKGRTLRGVILAFLLIGSFGPLSGCTPNPGDVEDGFIERD
jgi:hypothetical protein